MKWVFTNDVFPTWNAYKDLNSVHDYKMKAIMNIENLTTIDKHYELYYEVEHKLNRLVIYPGNFFSTLIIRD